jgi:hypothetical protein
MVHKKARRGELFETTRAKSSMENLAHSIINGRVEQLNYREF